MVLNRLQKFKNKYGIGFSGSRAKRDREDSSRKVNTTRIVGTGTRGVKKVKQYWNPMTRKWQATPVKAPVTKDHLNRDPSVGAANRKKIRENPVSDETLKIVKEKFAKKTTNDNGKTKTNDNGNGANKNNLKIDVDPKIGSKLPKKFDKPGSNGKTDKPAKEKAAWLKKTRKSPAAKAGFSDDERWALQQKHRKWKADRKAGKLKKKPLTRAEKMKRRR